MKTVNSNLYFFQNQKLVTLQKNHVYRSFLFADSVPLAEWGSDNANRARLLATDNNGSTLFTDSSKIEVLSYTAYGYTSDLLTQLSPIRFNSEPFHFLPALYLLGVGYHRGFAPQHMRFISPDNASPFGIGGYNAYVYCMSEPINSTDPSGHGPIKWIKNMFGRKQKIEAKLTAHNTSIKNLNNALQEQIILPSPEQINSVNNIYALEILDAQISKAWKSLPGIAPISKNTIKYQKKHDLPISKASTKYDTLIQLRQLTKKRIKDITNVNAMNQHNNTDFNAPTGETIGIKNIRKPEKEDWGYNP